MPAMLRSRDRSFIEPVSATPRAIVRRNVLVGEISMLQISRRRRVGAIAMAMIGISVLSFRRVDYDSPWVMFTELLISGGLIALAGCLALRRWVENNSHTLPRCSATDSSVSILVALSILFPWLVDRMARNNGFGNGMEIVMLSSLAWGGMAAASVGRQARTIGLSIVCSGFLTLFTTFISDNSVATLFAYAWGGLCLWWLVANHWERVEACAATHVWADKSQRWVVLGIGCLAFLIATAAVSDRVPVLRKLRAEVMPTSGGTGAKDSAARSGVGDGDALIAAREHATSFGAVETDLFLDSEKPSLFDVFSDEFGEPRKKDRVEQAQALSPNETRSHEGKFSEANRSSSGESFSTEREPPRQRPELNELASEALFFWSGESRVHLAVARFEEFDGIEWQQTSDVDTSAPTLIQVGERAWFEPPGAPIQNSISPFVDAIPEAIKFTRYNSANIPTRAGMQLWSVDQLTRTDFFSMASDGCLTLPGREQVPDYTVVRFVNSLMDLERIESLLENCAPGKSHTRLTETCQSSVASLAHRLASDKERGWDQVTAVIEGLRSEFKHDRFVSSKGTRPLAKKVAEFSSTESGATPLEKFLTARRGPSYLFATTAARMLKHLGYDTRLVSGFYVSPNHAGSAGDLAVLPRDAHVWLEINSGHGYWIPLEATPGYRQPRTTASWQYRLNKAKSAIAWVFVLTSTSLIGVYVFRRWLFELLCQLSWPLVALLGDRRRVACLLAGGHLLLDDLPGLGKTTLAKAIANCFGAQFSRVQCTPDLLPTDITGFNLFNQKTREFEFHGGPVFADILLADEINRTTPRTQSALFEAMAERQVTIDGHTRGLSATFFVIATQNPIDSHGAYPLPEAQLDRFAMKLEIGYPDRHAQLAILNQAQTSDASAGSEQLTTQALLMLQQQVSRCRIAEALQQYLVSLCEATREHESIALGISPRGMLLWQQVAKAWAILQNRDFVIPDDLQAVAGPVLSVRLVTRGAAPESVIASILESTAVPSYR